MVACDELPSPADAIESISASKTFLFSLLAGTVLIITLASVYRESYFQYSDKSTGNRTLSRVPFIYIQPSTTKVPPHRALYYSLEKYRTEISQAVQGLSHLLQQALAFEQTSRLIILPKAARLSTKVAERIEKLSKCLEDDEIVLQKLLEPFDLVTALPNKPSGPEFKKVVAVDNSLSSSTNDDSPEEPPPTLFQMVDSKRFQTIDENAYDSAAQIVAHLVRDWTSIGTLIRKSLYDWCFVQLDTYSKISDVVLVPGAGMGRLAYNLFRKGYTVEANELSPVMAAAANAILQRQMNGTLHPFALDPMSNEVDSNRRYDSVTFPDTLLIQGNKKGSLSFTIGDFVGEYYFSQANTFGAVVTCFFIDTATNIYEYISMIAQLLKPGGVWINVGPVQWHGNAILRPSVDELKELISYHQFDIVEWKVDEKPVSYRQDESSSGNKQSDDRVFVRTTDFSAYRPLRFVAIKRKR